MWAVADGWHGLAANFERELTNPKLQDPSLENAGRARWWHYAGAGTTEWSCPRPTRRQPNNW